MSLAKGCPSHRLIAHAAHASQDASTISLDWVGPVPDKIGDMAAASPAE